jgi:hypothetical protein
MTPERAAEVLRKKEASYRKAADVWRNAIQRPMITSKIVCVELEKTHTETADSMAMGAAALEFQAWLFEMDIYGWMPVSELLEKWDGEDSFLDYCKAEWEKDRLT